MPLHTRPYTNFAGDWSQVEFRQNNPAIHNCGKPHLLHKIISRIKCEKCVERLHFLNQYKHFGKLDYDARKSSVIEATLSWSCLKPNQTSKSSRHTGPCLKQDCNGCHTIYTREFELPKNNIYVKGEREKYACYCRSVRCICWLRI